MDKTLEEVNGEKGRGMNRRIHIPPVGTRLAHWYKVPRIYQR